MIGQLRYDEKSDRYYIDNVELHCGDCFSVLICNNSMPEWIETRIEMGEEWYLDGLLGFQLSGLFARI